MLGIRDVVEVSPVPSGFKTRWKVLGGESISLPLVSSYIYNFVVNWGDGSSDVITAYDDPNTIHMNLLLNKFC
jgi:hypothetical protein